MADTVLCNSCGNEVVTTTYREYEVYPSEGEPKKTMVPERETIRIEITHHRDFHHAKGYVEESWTGLLCEGCLQRLLHMFNDELEHWVD